MKETATYLGYRAAWRLTRLMPAAAARRLFDVGADRAYRSDGPGVRRLRDNLRRVVGSDPAILEPTVAEGMRSYARYWREVFRLPSTSNQRLLDTMHVDNADLLRAAYDAGNGAIVALPHAGNWDHAGAWAALSGYQLVSVAERLKPERLYHAFLEYRRSLGIEILPTTGGAQSPIDTLAARLRAGGLVVLLADRDLSSRGIPVRFCNDTIRIPPGPALLALRTGAPLFTANLWYTDEQTIARLDPVDLADGDSATEIVAGTCQRIADQFTAGISAHPADWHMLQRVFVPAPARETR